MAHPVYKLDGKRIPSVTTVIACLGFSKNQLMYWANKEGLEGRKLYENTEALMIGTIAHAAVEADIKGEEFDVRMLDGLSDKEAE